jgi:hypothetical protein
LSIDSSPDEPRSLRLSPQRLLALGVLASALNSSYYISNHSTTTCLGMQKLQKPRIQLQSLPGLEAVPAIISKTMTQLLDNSKSQV